VRLYGQKVERDSVRLCAEADIAGLDLAGFNPGDNPSSLCNRSLAQKVDARAQGRA